MLIYFISRHEKERSRDQVMIHFLVLILFELSFYDHFSFMFSFEINEATTRRYTSEEDKHSSADANHSHKI